MRYMRPTEQPQEGFLPLQDKILEIMVDLDRFCEENGVDYCLMGGSALGAKRHGGFIPWDDDLDIFMTPENYEKFRAAFLAHGDRETYYLQEWGATDGMVTLAKLRRNQTAYVEEIFQTWDIHQGIFVDIFILHACPNYRLAQLRQCFWAKYLVVKGLALRGYHRRGGLAGLTVKLAGLLPRHLWVRHALRQVYRYRDRETAYYCNFLGRAVFKNAIYPRRWFGENPRVPFETVSLRAPACLHAFLRARFGDYETPPSAERIRWQQHCLLWDTEHDFREKLPCIRDYGDEKNLL